MSQTCFVSHPIITFLSMLFLRAAFYVRTYCINFFAIIIMSKILTFIDISIQAIILLDALTVLFIQAIILCLLSDVYDYNSNRMHECMYMIEIMHNVTKKWCLMIATIHGSYLTHS